MVESKTHFDRIFKFAQFWSISSFASHDSRGFQLTPNGLEFVKKGYGDS